MEFIFFQLLYFSFPLFLQNTMLVELIMDTFLSERNSFLETQKEEVGNNYMVSLHINKIGS